jgi:hypothetical protein
MAAAGKAVLLPALAVGLVLLVGCNEPGFDAGRVPVSGFRPVAPPLLAEPFFRSPVAVEEQRGLATPLVESRQPTLRWEPAPGVHRPFMLGNPRADAAFLRLPAKRLAEVTYDVRIWPLWPGGAVPVYRRDAILGTSHRVETALAADTAYCWSVRARFPREDGRPAVSEWSLAMWPLTDARGTARARGFVPATNCYRLRTPPT